MNAIHRSSSSSYVYKYGLPILLSGAFTSTFLIANFNNTISNEELKGILMITFWLFTWATFLMINLRIVETNYKSLVIKKSKGTRMINYEDINWICETVLIVPVLILINYTEKQTNKSRTILFVPQFGSQQSTVIEETEMVMFIRKQIVEAKPTYSRSKEPSRWQPVSWFFFSGLVVLVLTSIF